ncbi:MAG TPA: HAD-IA family hydrolase [Candidatus Binataceae bacterium]|nr:HAD-IA family hydrolase [Candidatus Binataceae bacterium]
MTTGLKSATGAPAESATAIHGNPAARVWLFDFDNTLAALEREVDWAASRRELEGFLRAEGIGDAIFAEFPRRNLTLYDALLHRLRDRQNATPAPGNGSATAISHENPAALLRRASAIIEDYEMRGVARAVPLGGASELVDGLRARGNTVAVVTSNSSRTVARWLEIHRLDTHVAAIVGRDSLLALKPEPAIVSRALELTGASPAEAVLVGDSEADLRAARAAKVCFYGIAAEAEARGVLKRLGAQEIFASPAEVGHHLGMKSRLNGGLNA